jgi:hypothetical protein
MHSVCLKRLSGLADQLQEESKMWAFLLNSKWLVTSCRRFEATNLLSMSWVRLPLCIFRHEKETGTWKGVSAQESTSTPWLVS